MNISRIILPRWMFSLVVLIQIATGSFAQSESPQFEKNIQSPDGNLSFYLYQKVNPDGENQLSYKISYKSKPVILESSLDIQLDNHLSQLALALKADVAKPWCSDLMLEKVTQASRNTVWQPLYGERNQVRDHYNELTLQFQKASDSNYKIQLIIRAYNTLKLANGLYSCLTEAAMVDYVRTKFALKKNKPNTIVTSLYESVDLISYFNTPWRVIMVGEKPGDLIENNSLILNLNAPRKIKDAGWIKPGKIIREMTLTDENAKACVDFAAAHNLQYVLFDWKWYGPSFTFDSDARTVSIDLDLPGIIEYAKNKNIGIWLYVNQQALLKQDHEIFPLYKSWGVKGVKFGFVQVGSHRWTTWLHAAIQRAAENELMVNIHDEFRTTGEERTWPNMLTVEGIRGNEEMPDATHNTILPFTRGIAGAGDYTICYYNPRIKTTHAHQLALGVINYSPLQTLFWYDKPSDYKGEPEIEFFERLPTVWDETKILQGEPGEYIITARRKGEEWFVGAITNNREREVNLSLSFLQPGKKYLMNIYSDDPKITTRTQVKTDRRKVKPAEVLKLKLAASGGVALWIRGEDAKEDSSQTTESKRDQKAKKNLE